MNSYNQSDIHWEGTQRRKNTGWSWGDAKKRREVVTRFGQSSSIHAASYVCSPRRKSYSLLVKIVYRTLFTVCVLSVSSSIAFLLQENFSKESTFINTIDRDSDTGFEEDSDYFPLYPRITICRRPTYRTNFNESYMKLVHYTMLSLGTSHGPYTPSQQAMLVQIARHQIRQVAELSADEIHLRDTLQAMEERFKNLSQSEGFNLTQFVIDHSVDCREIFRSCLIHVYLRDCCDLFYPVLTNYGVCFTTRRKSQIPQLVTKAGDNVLATFDLITPEETDVTTEVGFRVFFSDPHMDVPISMYGDVVREDMANGMTTSIKVQLIKTDSTALHTPFHGMSHTCPTWEFSPTFHSTRFSTRMCYLKYGNELMKRKCNCKPINHYYSDVEDMRPCDPVDNYQCFYHAIFERNVSDLVSRCQPSCVVYSYKTESSYMGLGGYNYNSSNSRLEIMYNTQQYTYNEYRKATLSSIFSQIGGFLGLYLGASIITLVELLTFSVTWLWYRLAPVSYAKVQPHRQDKRY